jgi:hypothetical protein
MAPALAGELECRSEARIITAARSGEVWMTLRRSIIERGIPKVGTFERQQLREAWVKSN